MLANALVTGTPTVKTRTDELIAALLLIRLGQELGHASPLAIALADFVDALVRLMR